MRTCKIDMLARCVLAVAGGPWARLAGWVPFPALVGRENDPRGLLAPLAALNAVRVLS